MNIYLRSASQISVQEPLAEKWFENPICPENTFSQAIEPDYKQFIPASESRRMGRLIKRAVVTSQSALKAGKCEMPDAIISATGLGCIENTEKFLNAILDNDEECLPPTSFMQSTHNTIGSQIAIRLHCHGYNSTYSHAGMSFDSALLDAFIQLKSGKIQTALVGGYEEMTPDYFKMFQKIGYWHHGKISVEKMRTHNGINSFSGSCSMSMLLTNRPSTDTLCQMEAPEFYHHIHSDELRQAVANMLNEHGLEISDLDAVVADFSGNDKNDRDMELYRRACFGETPAIWYKHLFGESFCSSAFGVYVAATCLHKELIPKHLLYSQEDSEIKNPQHILVFNHFNSHVSLCLLSR